MEYIEANRRGREQLRTLLSRLSEEQLKLEAEDGWTVAAVLAHLAFYDNRMKELAKRWKKEGVGPTPHDTDIVNDAMKPLLLLIPANVTASLALKAAEEADAELESLPEALMPALEALVKEGKIRVDRSIHREAHIEQIERILTARR